MGLFSADRERQRLVEEAITTLKAGDYRSAESQLRYLVNHAAAPLDELPALELYLSWAVLEQQFEQQKINLLTATTESNKEMTQWLEMVAAGDLSRLSYNCQSDEKALQAGFDELCRIAGKIREVHERSKVVLGPESKATPFLKQRRAEIEVELARYIIIHGSRAEKDNVLERQNNQHLREASSASGGLQFPRPIERHGFSNATEAFSTDHKHVYNPIVHAPRTGSEDLTSLAELKAKVWTKVDGTRCEAHNSPSISHLGGDSQTRARSTSLGTRHSHSEAARASSAPPSDPTLEDIRQRLLNKNSLEGAIARSILSPTLREPNRTSSALRHPAVDARLWQTFASRTLDSSPVRGIPSPYSVPNARLGSMLAQPDFTNFDVRIEQNASVGEAREVKSWFERHESEVQSFMEQRRRDRDVKVKVAILDTGFEAQSNTQATQKLWKTIDKRTHWKSWVSNPAIMEDTNGHGTHCALSLHEVAPAAELYIGRVCVNGNDLAGETVAQAIKHCVDEWNVDIISMSFGFRPGSPSIQTLPPAIAYAARHNKLMFAAAGNGGTGNPRTYPATDHNVFCVFSACAKGKPSPTNPNPLRTDWNFCCLGEHVTMPRSGEEAVSKRKTMSGSSVATPIAAGFAALVLEYTHQAKIPNQMSIREPAKLKTMRGMRAVFLKMIEHDENVVKERHWRSIEPWNLLAVPIHLMTGKEEDELEQRRTRVPVDINRALETVHL